MSVLVHSCPHPFVSAFIRPCLSSGLSLSLSVCLFLCQVTAQALGHFKTITLMAENGHFERPAIRLTSDSASSTTTTDEESNRVPPTDPGRPDGSKPSADLQDGWTLTTPDVDLSWMDPVENSCQYFEQRTPGSSVLRTATSVTFNYHNAQRY